MLFTGSKNYPEDNYIEKVVNKHNGHNNASTGGFITTYYYELAEDGLEEFVKVLVDAIHNPNLDVGTIKKEVNNVNSEISMRMTFDKTLGCYKLLKAVGNPDAKILSDAFGNISLEKVNFDQLQKDMVDIHSKYYSANLMKFVIMGNKELEHVAKIAEEHFATIPNTGIERPLFNDPSTYVQPFNSDVLGSIYYLQGLKQPSQLSLVFIVPSMKTETAFLPRHFFQILLFYYGTNSFHLKLLEEQLITDMDVDNLWEDYVNDVFCFQFNLTENGEKNVSRIIQHYYNFIEQVKKMRSRKETYKSLSDISKFTFLFKMGNSKLWLNEPDDNLWNLAYSYSRKLQDFKLDELFRAKQVFDDYDDERFSKWLDTLRVENSVIILQSKGYKNIVKNYVDSSQNDTGNAATGNNGVGVSSEVNNEGGRILLNRKSYLKDSRILKIKHIRRILTETPTSPESPDASETPETPQDLVATPTPDPVNTPTAAVIKTNPILDEYLNTAIEKAVLDNNFEFDGRLAYTHKKLPETLLKEIKETAKRNENFFTTLSEIETSFVGSYNVLTSCKAPELPDIAKTSTKIDSEAKGRLLAEDSANPIVNKELVDPKQQYLSTFKMYDLIFRPKNNEIALEDRKYLDDLSEFKKCLYKDFAHDTKERRVEVVSNEENAALWYKLYRVNLQPRFMAIYSIESEHLFKKILLNPESSIKYVLRLSIFCSYIERHIELKYPEEYISGKMFRCKRNNFGLVFEFSGISNRLEDFAMAVLETVFGLTNPHDYIPFLIDTIKKGWLDKFSNFNINDAKTSGFFYLSLATDKLFFDYSTPDKADFLKSILDETGPEEISTIVGNMKEKLRVTLLNVGSVSIDSSKRMFHHMKTHFMKYNSELSLYLIEPRMRSKIQVELNVDIGEGQHKVLRRPNNDPNDTNSVYITTFKIGILSKKEYIFVKILARYLHDKVFQKLRNDENLGYVASAFFHDVHMVS